VPCDAEATAALRDWPRDALERAALDLSFLAHAAVHLCSNASRVFPEALAVPFCAVSEALGRHPVLTYYSYNCCNWYRFDSGEPVRLGNIARIRNFLGGKDEEWFSTVHVAVEALAGQAIAACCAAQLEDDPSAHLVSLATSLREMRAVLQRMDEGCDPYVYHRRVRTPMAGLDDVVYEGVASAGPGWRTGTYLGETGAQSSVVPAIDAALGLRCESLGENADAAAATLVPYLQTMREQYMPPKHARLIAYLERGGPALRARCAEAPRAAAAFNDAVAKLAEFRKLHLSLAYRFVRKFDDRSDAAVLGTGGTAFMPYLRAHRDATIAHAISSSSSSSS